VSIAIEQLPDNVDALRTIIAEQLTLIAEQQSIITEKLDLIAEQKNEIIILGERVKLLQSEIFGRRSEKWNGESEVQGLIFNEMEQYAAVEPDAASEETANDDGAVKKSRRPRRAGRKPKEEALPEWLPRENVYHELPEEEMGARRFIKWEIRESLVVERPEIRVLREHFGVYAPAEGVDIEGEPDVKTAPRPPRLLERSIASAALLAHVIISKFCDGIPLYRQEGMVARWEINISRQSMSNWGLRAASRCERLVELLEGEELVAGPHIASDETEVQVLNEPNRGNTNKSYMWVLRGGTRDGPVVRFKYRESHSASFLNELLAGYRGTLLTDGLKSYDVVAGSLNIVHAGCWDHVRRPFRDVLKAGKSEAAEQALHLIGRLYRVERYGRRLDLSPEQILELRRRKSKPVVDEFREWLDCMAISTAPKSLLGRAIAYALGQWSKLIVFLNDGNVPISNIAVENAIRPFVIGRKAWLFAGSPRGAKASAIFYTLIETAKANGLDPYWYLRYLFERLPYAENDHDLKALLPTRLKMDTIRTFFKPDENQAS